MELATATLAAQRLYKALGTGDAAAIDELLMPDFVGHTTAGLPLGLGGTYLGPQSMRDEFWWRIGEHFRLRAEPESFEWLGEDGLQVTGTYSGTGRATGRAVEAAFVHVLTFDGDRISSLTQLTDTAPWHAALEGR
jgi:2-(1,2-epoxy-1,2-dihydrophenyl)acetyl-CoA isomerase